MIAPVPIINIILIGHLADSIEVLHVTIVLKKSSRCVGTFGWLSGCKFNENYVTSVKIYKAELKFINFIVFRR